MLKKKELTRKLSEQNLDFYETVSDVLDDNAIELGNLEELLTFISRHGIDTIFFHYDYATAEELQITDMVIDKLNIDEEIQAVMQTTFQKYNRRVEQLDFSCPYSLTVYCIYQNFIIYCDDFDYWFREMGYGVPQKIALELIEEQLDAISRKKEKAAQEREKKRSQLRQRILEDESFHKCTNKELRRAYTQKLWNSDESIQALFYSPKHGLYDIMIGVFIEEVWREYKESR